MAEDPVAPRLEAVGWIRGMNPGLEGGGSQPHVFSTTAGPYMVKVMNNPQGPRVLTNELVGGLCLDWLGVNHPRPAIIDVPAEAVEDSPGAKFADGTVLASGLAFGSELWQSDPQGTVDPGLLVNKNDIAGTLAFDTWVRQHDSRQYRVRASRENPGKYDFIAIDQGYSFGSPNWDAATLSGDATGVVVATPPVALTRSDLQAAISRLRDFGRDDADKIVNQVPTGWLTTEERNALVNYLETRAPLAADALEASFKAP